LNGFKSFKKFKPFKSLTERLVRHAHHERLVFAKQVEVSNGLNGAYGSTGLTMSGLFLPVILNSAKRVSKD